MFLYDIINFDEIWSTYFRIDISWDLSWCEAFVSSLSQYL